MSPAISSSRSWSPAASLAASIIRGSTSAAIRRSERSSRSFAARRLPMKPGYPVRRASAISERAGRRWSQRSTASKRPDGPRSRRARAALEHDCEAQVAIAPAPAKLGKRGGVTGRADLAVQAVDLAPQLDLRGRDPSVAQDLVAQAQVWRDA